MQPVESGARRRVLFVAQRTAIVAGLIPPHGSGAHVAATLAGLRAHFEVDAALGALPDPTGPAGRAQAIRRFVPAPVRGLRHDLLLRHADHAFLAALRRLARERTPDVVYERSEYFSEAGATLARELDVPFVLEANGLLAADARTMYRSFAEPFGSQIERRKLARADVIVTVSPGLAERLVELGAPPDRIAIVPNSVPDARVRPAPRPRREGPIAVGWIGHLMGWHLEALHFLVDVAPAALAAGADVRFVVFGSGPGLEELRARIADTGLTDVFQLRGSIPYADVPSALETVDLGIIPDVFDYAFPVKLVEMGAAGLPVLAPRSESLDRMLAPGREYEPFARRDADGLAGAIASLASDPKRREALGANLLQAVRSRFTWSATGAHLADVVDRALASR